MAEQTPGSWRNAGRVGFGILIRSASGEQVAVVYGPSVTERAEENAALIAAAPNLLEVLELALRESGCDGDLCAHEWHDLARAAIAKAKGES